MFRNFRIAIGKAISPFGTIAFALTGFGCAFTAWADDDAMHWLMRISGAPQEVSYTGTFIYLHDKQIETMQVARLVSSNGVRERLFSLNGAAREIIRDKESVWCYLPDQKIGVHEYRQVAENSFPSILPRNLEDLTRYYDIALGKRERIANRIAQQIDVHPKDALRYGYDLWADVESGLLLRADLVSLQNETIEQYMFANVEIGGIVSEAALKPITMKSDLSWFSDEVKIPSSPTAEAAGELAWRVDKVPPGFMLSRHIRRMSPMHKTWVEHFVFTDGLAAVSVFVRDKSDKNAQPLAGMQRMGAVHAFGRMQDDHQITVVGEVPGETVSIIGNAVTAAN
ncbi:MAG: MucB/RseB C-terminal domain-containing protein [Arenicellales bacterium WSBS_2016_MAG_OTU3]